MSFINETLGQSPLGAALHAGLDVLSQNQTVTFTKYVRVILPLDGYVFWVRSNLLSEGALYNAVQYNNLLFNESLSKLAGAEQITVKGSLHFASTYQEDPDEGFTINQMIFTSQRLVTDLNAVSPMVMYIAEINQFRYAFSRRESFYRQAELWHYVGDAVWPVMDPQIIDTPQGFDSINLIVSNSLPIWLSLNKFFPVFPAYLVPQNFKPPYASAEIIEGSTRALQIAPYIDENSDHWQLMTETVHISIYGLRNFNALDYQDYVLDQSLSTEIFGLMNMPVIHDEVRKQIEVNTLAQKKSITFDINYYQARVSQLARQFIRKTHMDLWLPGGVIITEPTSRTTTSFAQRETTDGKDRALTT
jgi:hypothetical protein